MNDWICKLAWLVFVVACCGCTKHSTDVATPNRVADDGEFEVFWPPRQLERRSSGAGHPLLLGTLSVSESETDASNAFQLEFTLRRPSDDEGRVRWNKNLAFPEYSWMSKVRVWDRDRQWLWPNLAYLLRAHGEERVERYGGIDPGKGVDNDFAAVLVRSLKSERRNGASIGESIVGVQGERPLVSAEWYSVDGADSDGKTVAHVARSDTFEFHLLPHGAGDPSGVFGVWLIYADFLEADTPRGWPVEKEYAGGILAYFEVQWRRNSDGQFSFDIEQLTPTSATGFHWAGWSTGDNALEKQLRWVEGREGDF